MVDIKVPCPCGTKYKFEVEPVNNRIPHPVACPACGADGTDQANAFLASRPVAAAAPALSMPKPALSVARHEPPPPPPPTEQPAFPQATPTKAKKPASAESGIGMGVVGAAIGGAIGMLIWYAVIRFTGYEIGWIAWAVGGLTGFGAKLMTKEFNQKLGFTAVGIAFVAILGGELLGVRHGVRKEMEKFTQDIAKGINFEDIKKEAEKLGANPTDADIRKFLAAEAAAELAPLLEGIRQAAGKEGKAEPAELKPENIQASDVADFKKSRLGLLKDVAAGKLTEEAYRKRMASEMSAAASDAVGWKDIFSAWTILWLFLGLGSAWKLATGQDD